MTTTPTPTPEPPAAAPATKRGQDPQYPHKNEKAASHDEVTLKKSLLTTLVIASIGGIAEAIIGYLVILAVTKNAPIAILLSVTIAVIVNYGIFTAAVRSHSNPTTAYIILTMWALLGAGLVGVRIFGSQLDPPITAIDSTPETIAAATAAKTAGDIAVGIILGLLYWLCGATTYVKLRELTNPMVVAMVKAKTRVDALRALYEETLQNVVQARHQTARRLAEIDLLPSKLQAQAAVINAMTTLSKEEWRRKIAELLATASESGVINTPFAEPRTPAEPDTKPEPPAEPETPGTDKEARP
jgi:hypothetical protein